MSKLWYGGGWFEGWSGLEVVGVVTICLIAILVVVVWVFVGVIMHRAEKQWREEAVRGTSLGKADREE